MKKRLTFLAVFAFAMCCVLSVLAPSSALARHHGHGGHRPPPHFRPPHYGWLWYPPFITSQIINRPTVTVVYDYNTYRQNFISGLDDEESALFIWLDSLPKGKHIEAYGKEVTKRRLKKIISALYKEYRYTGVQNGYIYFEKL